VGGERETRVVKIVDRKGGVEEGGRGGGGGMVGPQ
jgi:hypothetical protein